MSNPWQYLPFEPIPQSTTALHIHGDQKNAHLPKCEESDINKGVLLPARQCTSWPDVPHYITCKLAASQGKCFNWDTAVRRGRGCLDLLPSPRTSPAASIFSTAHNSLLLETPGSSCNSCPRCRVLSPLTSLSSSGHTRHPLYESTELRTRRGGSRWLPKNQSKAVNCAAASAKGGLTGSPPLLPFPLDCRMLVKQTELYKQSAAAAQDAQVFQEKVG